jgi:hypothetical protein
VQKDLRGRFSVRGHGPFGCRTRRFRSLHTPVSVGGRWISVGGHPRFRSKHSSLSVAGHQDFGSRTPVSPGTKHPPGGAKVLDSGSVGGVRWKWFRTPGSSSDPPVPPGGFRIFGAVLGTPIPSGRDVPPREGRRLAPAAQAPGLRCQGHPGCHPGAAGPPTEPAPPPRGTHATGPARPLVGFEAQAHNGLCPARLASVRAGCQGNS